MKPKLLIIQLWAVGDLIIGTPFLRKASEQFDVTLLAKPFALDLQPRFWPAVKVIPFSAPWTSFDRKYHIFSWPWLDMFSVWRNLCAEQFDVALSARWDPRDHFLLFLTGAKARLGFPRAGSQFFLTRRLELPKPDAHRYEYWRIIGQSLNLNLEPSDKISLPDRLDSRIVVVHTGAAQPVRIWPLDNYRKMVKKLREHGHQVRVVCNPEQQTWWQDAGESQVTAPKTISELLHAMDDAAIFIGNDSGPGHLAAFCGIPTFTIFGDQVAEWFVPLHPEAEFVEGKACPYKPCSDYCRFPIPHCLWNISEAEVWPRVEKFVSRHLNQNLPGQTTLNVV